MPDAVTNVNFLLSSASSVANSAVLTAPQVGTANTGSLPAPQSTTRATTKTAPMAGSFFSRLKYRELCLFDHILNQIASMLGADELGDLPKVDQERVKIVVNQAYRECYAPVDGYRPRWASRKMSIYFPTGTQSRELDGDVIDVEKVPVLTGHGPLSPMNARTDEISARSHYSGDFRPIGGYQGNFPSIDMDKPESGRPIWYYIDQVDDDEDFTVIPRLVLYPIPDKEYNVELVANIIPEDLQLGDTPRLPGEVCWDILLPIAQYKLLTDPRYNGDNKELIVQSATEARRKLKHFSSPQKQRTIRIVRRGGW
jgi:hypothetical protein